ncbi:MAG TPA: DUF2007 domain-containing protein [Acidimicrobiia bacterium]|jgi:hypothetical protein
MTEHEHSPTEYEPDVVGEFTPEDDIVEVYRANGVMEAELIARELRAAGIRAAEYGDATAGMLGTLDHMEGARVMVRRDDFDAATVIVQEVIDREKIPATPEGDAELTRLAEESKGFSDPETGAQV